jgi:hypothetical protein
MSYSPLTNPSIEFRCQKENQISKSDFIHLSLQEYVFTASSFSRFDERKSRRKAATVQNLRRVIRNQALSTRVDKDRQRLKVYMHIWFWEVSLACKERISVKVVVNACACIAEIGRDVVV